MADAALYIHVSHSDVALDVCLILMLGVSCLQGAFMAALYAQGLSWERMHRVVRDYAGAMGSVRHLLSDLTLPLISVFSGAGFDRVVRESFGHGAERIEDLWLKCA